MANESTEKWIVAGSNGELERLYKYAPVGLAVLNEELCYVRINEMLARLNGRSVEEHLGRTIHDVIPGVASTVASICQRVLASGEPALNLRINGSIRPGETPERSWHASYYPLADAMGRVQAISVVVLDMSDQARAEEALRNQIAVNQQRLHFERFLSETSSHFINLPGEQINTEIESALKRAVEFLDVDQAIIALFTQDGSLQFRAYQRDAAEFSPMPTQVAESTLPWHVNQTRQGRLVVHDRLPDDLPPEVGASEREFVITNRLLSHIGVPIHVGGEILGAITFETLRSYRHWSDEVVQDLRLLADVFANALDRKRNAEAITAAMADIKQLKDRLQAENVYLREEIELQYQFDEIIGDSPGLKKVLRQVDQVASTDSTVLILGETGTGKELLARAIHSRSARGGHPMVKVSCAALPSTLVESELFGREKGAYTGALTRQRGRFEVADGSTLFLDEIGELPSDVQAKLLRVLQEGQFERLGSSQTLRTNVRIIAATNRDLRRMITEGTFREDLYYRLSVFPIHVPPLCERRDDIPRLVWAFVKEFSTKIGKTIDSIPRATMEAVQQYPWPGNIRELRNTIERAIILSEGETLRVELPPLLSEAPLPKAEVTLDDAQRKRILDALHRCGWRIRGASGAAAILGVKPTTLEAKMQRLKIARP